MNTILLYIFFAIILFTIFVYVMDNKVLDNIWLVLVFLILIFYLNTLGQNSPDHNTYIKYYVDTGIGTNQYKYEKGFMMLNKFLYGIFKNNYNGLFIFYYTVIASLFTIGIRYLIFNIKREYLFIIPAMFVNMVDPGSILVRQYWAIGICLISIRFLCKKKYIKFALVVFLATFFHVTAYSFLLIVFLFIFLMENIKLKYKIIGLFIILIGFISITKMSYISQKIALYFNAQDIVDENKVGLVVTLFLAINILYLFIIILKGVKLTTFYEKFSLAMGIIFFIIYIGFMKYGFVTRLALYYQIFMYGNMVDAIDLFENKNLKIALFLIYSLILTFVALKVYGV